LFTDLYELTMCRGYFAQDMHARPSCFDLFFRKPPFEGGFAVAAGLADALAFLHDLRFSENDLAYLRSLNLFDEAYLAHLREFVFSGDVWAVPEGTIVFPGEPLLRVQGALEQCQLVESALLNIINFQTLIATKAARVCLQAGFDNVLEFGLRRAQGPDGARMATRAAYIGGCVATSNVQAGADLEIPVRGTHAHSWVMAFASELESFRAFAAVFPTNSILLVDTYDTLASGVPNAITVAREMRERGEALRGIRLDSGDLARLSREARRMLDEAGFPAVKIFASGDLDETLIEQLKKTGACIDVYGVGTRLVTAHDDPALTGVYKLAAIADERGVWRNTRKKSDSLEKATLPGIKQVWRLHDDRVMVADWIELASFAPDPTQTISGYLPSETAPHQFSGIVQTQPLLQACLRAGEILPPQPSLPAIRAHTIANLNKLPEPLRRLANPAPYPVTLGPRLWAEM